MPDNLDELIKACYDLAQESVEWMRLKQDANRKGIQITDEELSKKTQNGAWEKYLRAGGSRTMINHQLPKEKDFGGQYDKLCNEI